MIEAANHRALEDHRILSNIAQGLGPKIPEFESPSKDIDFELIKASTGKGSTRAKSQASSRRKAGR